MNTSRPTRRAGGYRAIGTGFSVCSPTSSERHRADRTVPAVVKLPARYRLRPDPSGARHRVAARQSVLRLSGLATRQEAKAATT